MATYTNVLHKHHHQLKSTRSIGLWAGFAVGVLLLIVTAIIAHKHQLTGSQARLFYDIDSLKLPSIFTTLAKIMTEGLGAAYPIVGCGAIAALRKNYRLAWRFLFTAGGAAAVFYVVKKVINEPRPISMLHGRLHQRVVETGPGFPSGHEAIATALALTLWFVVAPKWRFISVLWIITVAFSRLYLGVHTPGDVLGGFGLGLAAVCFVRLLPQAISSRVWLSED